MSMDFYKLLGIEKNASQDDIKKAYRKLSKQYHPDLQQGKSETEKKAAEEKFKEISEAYATLSDSDKRHQYDMFGADGYRQHQGGQPFDLGSFFREHASMFGDFFGGAGNDPTSNFGFGGFNPFNSGHNRNQNVQMPGKDVRVQLEITEKEMIFGTEKEFSFNSHKICDECNGTGCEKDSSEEICPECKGIGQVISIQQNGFMTIQTSHPCQKCNGSGKINKHPCHCCNGNKVVPEKRTLKIKIPAGLLNGEKLRIQGHGEPGINGGHAGDLYVIVTYVSSGLFERMKNRYDLKTTHYVNPIVFLIGGTEHVLTPSGQKIEIDVDLKNMNRPVCLKGCGIGSGDLYVDLKIDEIQNISNDQYRRLSELLDEMKTTCKFVRKDERENDFKVIFN